MLIDVLVGSVHTVQKNTEALVVASNEIGLEVNVNTKKTIYMVISRDRNAVQNHNNKFFDERVEHFRYL